MKVELFFLLSIILLYVNVSKSSVPKEPENNKFVLITVLYNEPVERRIEEYITCLERNMNHAMIHKIHVIYDTSADNKTKEHPILNWLNSFGIEMTFILGRPTFDYCFSVANNRYPNNRVILANADIYFNESLNLLEHYNLTDTFLALTRWDDDGVGNIKRFSVACSQDVWIFETPIKKFWRDDIQIGTYHCDSWIMYCALNAKLNVVNPCLTVQCCHLHSSKVRHYPWISYPKGLKAVSQTVV